jgi:hypothetical protein
MNGIGTEVRNKPTVTCYLPEETGEDDCIPFMVQLFPIISLQQRIQINSNLRSDKHRRQCYLDFTTNTIQEETHTQQRFLGQINCRSAFSPFCGEKNNMDTVACCVIALLSL